MPGISFFDTALAYGDCHSEQLLSRAFGKSADVVIASKVPSLNRATDLADRLVIFNTACAIFAIVWYAAEWYERKGDATEATHPPAPLRYMRFRTFQRRVLIECSKSDPSLNFRVDMRSTLFLEVLAEMCPLFRSLYNITPMLKDTEEMLALDAYESQLSGCQVDQRLHKQNVALFWAGHN